MRNLSVMIAAIYFILACAGCAPKDKPAVKIGSIELSQKEFETAFKRSPNGASISAASRKQFLDVLIERKLILKEAEKLGLDKDPAFLASVQIFWEQSLLKLVLNEKIRELSEPIKISEQEVKEYYEKHKDEFAGKKEAEAIAQISLELFKDKQKKALDGWIDSLKKNTKIKVDYQALGIQPGE